MVDELSTDHREALALLDEILATTDPATRRDLADTVITELVRHSVAEEMFVYPAIRTHLPDGEKAVEYDTKELEELEETMSALESCDAGDPRFVELVTKLKGQLRHHVTEEEGKQFPQLRASIPREELVQMREKVDAAKLVAPTRPHPNAPNNQVFHKLVGPGVGLMDRVRDKLTGRNTP